MDHEVVGEEDEPENFWSSAIFQGSSEKITMYDGHNLFGLENSEKLKSNLQKTHARAEIKNFWTLS